jgi:Fe-S cluster assembly protein SufD
MTTPSVLERLIPSQPPGVGDPSSPSSTYARAWLETNGLPSARDEAWKYTPLGDILAATFDVASEPAPDTIDVAMLDELAGDHGGTRLVFVNGRYAPSLSRDRRIAPGLVCRSTSPSSADPDGLIDPPPPLLTDCRSYDGFQALSQLASDDGAVIVVDADTRVTEPIHVVHLSVPGPTPVVSHPRTRLHAAARSAVTLIETYSGLAGPTLTNAVTTIVVEPGAAVTHYKIQAEKAGAVHVAHTSIRQGAGSTVRSGSFALGADIARNAIDVVLDGNGANLELEGLYLPIGAQRHDNVITVEHAASACTSRQRFKGVMDDHARGSFSGRIIVQPGTTATDAAQTSRSLLLKPTAEADTRPWLEIFADDVKCTHGATVGRLDSEALFYLRTRGITESDARTMLIGAFIDEMTEAVSPPTLRSHLDTTIATRRPSGTPKDDPADTEAVANRPATEAGGGT